MKDKIVNFTKKSIYIFSFYLPYLLSSRIVSSENILKYPINFSHQECATLNDPNYSHAFYVFNTAISIYESRLYFFPDANTCIRDACGNRAFDYEGSLSWQVHISRWDARPPYDFSCTRVIRKSAQVDVENSIFLEEKQTFNFHKDPFSLLSAFSLLLQDVAFINESNEDFLFRRFRDYENYYHIGLFDRYVPIRIGNLKEYIEDCKRESILRQKLAEERQEEAIDYCKKSLDYCIAHHNDPLAHINRGLFDYLEGNAIDALDQINAALKKAKPEDLESLKDHALLLKGRSELETGLYADAVLTLTELIDKHPDNKDAYLDRAEAYFELANFDSSLEDYLTSGIKPEPILPDLFEMLSFAAGLRDGIGDGGAQATIEFVPSLLSSLQGINHGLWAFAENPVPTSKEFVQATQNCITFLKEHTVKDTLLEIAPEVKELLSKWDSLEYGKRGKLTGQIIGKYGIEILSGAGIAKAMKTYRELKRANNLMTFEAMAISERNKSLLKLESAKKAQARKEVLQHANLKIQPDKQGKHLTSHQNYIQMKIILEHPNPQKLVNEYAGKGMKVTNFSPGVPGYQESVNFGEFIGYFVERETGEKIATNWGKIHYAKDGTHIVPTKPR